MPNLLRYARVAPAPRTRFLLGQRDILFKQLGISTVLDIGANQGQYAQQLRRSGYRGKIYSFEPGSEALRALRRSASRDRFWHVHGVALGASNRQASLHVWRGSGTAAASLHKPGSGLTRLLGAPALESVHVSTLTDWLIDHPEVNLTGGWLKLDVQGSEHDVLLGAAQHLSRLAAVELEMPLRDWYVGEASLPQLLEILANYGFVPATIMTERFHVGWLGAVDVDAIFVRADLSRLPA